MTLLNRKCFVVVAAIVLLQACATQQAAPPPPDYSQWDKLMKGGECSPGTAALIGAALGAMIGDEDRTRSAAIGAGIGALACYIINTQSRQTRAPAEVEGQYRAEQRGTLPESALVTAYDTAFNAGGGVRAGQEARVVSNITVVSGTRDPVREVVEVLEVFESGDATKVLLRAEKKSEPGMLAGGVQNSFSIRLPTGLVAGTYPARTVLYVNGKVAGENRGALRVLGAR